MKKILTMATILSTISFSAYATPVFESGTGLDKTNPFVVDGNTYQVNQAARTAKINFTTIDTSHDQTLKFNQPNSNALAVAKVTNGQATKFEGSLSANGRVVLVNEAGLTFTNGSRVNVNALTLAATKDVKIGSQGQIYNDTLDYEFTTTYEGVVTEGKINLDGEINTKGDVAIGAKEVNFGPNSKITTQGGDVSVVATKGRIILYSNTGGAVFVNNTSGKINYQGTIKTNGGTVIMTAYSKHPELAALNVDGIIDTSITNSASKVNRNHGFIGLFSSGDINLKGNLNAGNHDLQVGNSFFGKRVNITSSATIEAKRVVLRPEGDATLKLSGNITTDRLVIDKNKNTTVNNTANTGNAKIIYR